MTPGPPRSRSIPADLRGLFVSLGLNLCDCNVKLLIIIRVGLVPTTKRLVCLRLVSFFKPFPLRFLLPLYRLRDRKLAVAIKL